MAPALRREKPVKPGDTGLTRIWKATGYSVAGLRAAWRHESAFRQETVLVVLMVPLALWLGQSVSERMFLIATGLMVLVVELLNSAVEAAVDRIGHDPHNLSGQAKDLGSAAVFVSLVTAGLVWTAVTVDRFVF
jgi:diacylglycerol kinase (ATP)